MELILDVSIYYVKINILLDKWDKLFKNGPSKICRRQLLKDLKGYGLLQTIVSLQIF